MTTEWKSSQVFGKRAPGDPVEDVDIVSAIEFENRGEYLATGDHGGHVVVFERTDGKDPRSRKELESIDRSTKDHPRFMYKTEFQSHEPEFDYLRSLEIEEKINKLRWCASPNNSLFILSTNDRTIKLWKVLEHKVKKVKEVQVETPHVLSENALLAEKSFMGGENVASVPNGNHLDRINRKPDSGTPTYQEGPSMTFNMAEGVSSRCRRVYAHAHDYNINSISNNSYGTCIWSPLQLQPSGCMSISVRSCQSYTTVIPFSTNLIAALAWMGVILLVALTAILSKFSHLTKGQMGESHWKLEETQTGYPTFTMVTNLQDHSPALFVGTTEEGMTARDLTRAAAEFPAT